MYDSVQKCFAFKSISEHKVIYNEPDFFFLQKYVDGMATITNIWSCLLVGDIVIKPFTNCTLKTELTCSHGIRWCQHFSYNDKLISFSNTVIELY